MAYGANLEGNAFRTLLYFKMHLIKSFIRTPPAGDVVVDPTNL